jgi:DtxR family transcriptional regulator, Mn-dependent transcriptional regulator
MTESHESSEDYLERILMLQEKGVKEIHAVDLATSFSYSKASVSIALKKLEERGLVALGSKSQLYLTKEGYDTAYKVYEKHKIIGSVFMSLGVSEEVAFRDACKIEHDISDETFEAIKKHCVLIKNKLL